MVRRVGLYNDDTYTHYRKTCLTPIYGQASRVAPGGSKRKPHRGRQQAEAGTAGRSSFAQYHNSRKYVSRCVELLRHAHHLQRAPVNVPYAILAVVHIPRNPRPAPAAQIAIFE